MDLIEIAKAIKDFKPPKIYRDVITIVGGMGFLLILYTLKLKSLTFNFGISLSKFELDFLILICSFLVGRILLSLLYSLDRISYLVSRIGKKEDKETSLWQKFKKYIFYREALSERISQNQVKESITVNEIWKALSEAELFEEHLERSFINVILLKFFISYTILGLLFFHSETNKLISLTLFLYFILEWYLQNRKIILEHIELQKGIVKNYKGTSET